MSLRRLFQLRLLCMLGYACCVVPAAHSVGAQAVHQDTATISGKVVDAAGRPVSGVTVTLRGQAPAAEWQRATDALGVFLFRDFGKGPFQLTAEARGKGTATIAVPENASKPVTLVLSESAAGKPAGDGLAFSDGPNFTVAGVTDWTAVGGHGSDATLRTSEDLARTTAALRSQDGATGGATGSGSREAEERLRAAVKASPRDYAANLALGEFYLHAKQYAQAEPSLKAATAAGNGRADAEYDLALACRGLGDAAAAKLHITRALQVDDRAEFHRLAGELDEQAGDAFAAVRQMERAAELDPSEPNYFAWGSELLLHRAILQAGQIFARGAALYPASARLRTGWGSALFSGARYEEAAQRLCEASDLQPKVTEPYLVLGKADAASPTPLPCVVERLERFLKLEPRDARASYLLATALIRRGDVSDAPRAEALLRQAVQLDANDAEAYLELGKVAAAKQQPAEAMELYRKAIACDPQLGEAHFRLAALYARAGKPAEAKQERELHEAIEQQRADAVEQERRSVKQFLVVLQGANGTPAN